MRRGAAVVAALVLGLVALTGCDRHAAALAGPSRESLERIRMATIDVLLDKGYAILETPVCRYVDGNLSCTGTTTDGGAIAVSERGDRPDAITVTVDGTSVFEGSVRQVIEDAGRAS